ALQGLPPGRSRQDLITWRARCSAQPAPYRVGGGPADIAFSVVLEERCSHPMRAWCGWVTQPIACSTPTTTRPTRSEQPIALGATAGSHFRAASAGCAAAGCGIGSRIGAAVRAGIAGWSADLVAGF